MEGSGGSGSNPKDGPLWTTDTMRENRGNWNLAADVNVLRYLQNFSENLLKETESTLKSLSSLEEDLNTSCIEISTVANKFLSLADSQFVENRVYDDEETPTPDGPDTSSMVVKSKEQIEAEIQNRLKEALMNGFDVLNTKFEAVKIINSDSDDDDDDGGPSGIVYKPINPFNNRPLPHLIDSVEFMKDPTVGLKDPLSEEEDELEEESLEESISESKQLSENEDSEPESERTNVTFPKNQVQVSDDIFNPAGMSFAEHLAARLENMGGGMKPSRSDDMFAVAQSEGHSDFEQDNFDDDRSNDFEKNSDDMFVPSSKSSLWEEDDEDTSRRRVMQDLERRLARDIKTNHSSEQNSVTPSPPARDKGRNRPYLENNKDFLFEDNEDQDGLFNPATPKKMSAGAVNVLFTGKTDPFKATTTKQDKDIGRNTADSVKDASRSSSITKQISSMRRNYEDDESDDENALFTSNDKSSSQNSSVRLSESFHDDTFSVKSNKSGGLFDDEIPTKGISTKVMDDLFKDIGNDKEDDDDDLFGSYFKKDKNTKHSISKEPSQASSNRKSNHVDDLFSDVYEDDLFANLNVKNFEKTPVTEDNNDRKLVHPPSNPKESLFSDSDSESEFLSSKTIPNPPKTQKEISKPVMPEIKPKAPEKIGNSLFDEETSDLFGSDLFSSKKSAEKQTVQDNIFSDRNPPVLKNPINVPTEPKTVLDNKDKKNSSKQLNEQDKSRQNVLDSTPELNEAAKTFSLFDDYEEEIDSGLFGKDSFKSEASGDLFKTMDSSKDLFPEESSSFVAKDNPLKVDNVFLNKNMSPYETEPPPLFSEPEDNLKDNESIMDKPGNSILFEEDYLFKLQGPRDVQKEEAFKDSLFTDEVLSFNGDIQKDSSSEVKSIVELDKTVTDPVPSLRSISFLKNNETSEVPPKAGDAVASVGSSDVVQSPLFDDVPIEQNTVPPKPTVPVKPSKPMEHPKPELPKPAKPEPPKPFLKPEPPKSLNIRGPISGPDEFGSVTENTPDDPDGGSLSTETKVTPPKITPGKLNLEQALNIDPKALLPGAAPKSFKKTVVSNQSDNVSPEKDAKSENFPDTGSVLHSIAKDRAKIQVKRRPQTRRARHLAIQQSTIEKDEVDVPDNTALSSEDKSPPSVERSSVLSPSTDEEDLFGVPPLELPPDYNKISISPGDIFGAPKVLSPDFIMEKESKGFEKPTTGSKEYKENVIRNIEPEIPSIEKGSTNTMDKWDDDDLFSRTEVSSKGNTSGSKDSTHKNEIIQSNQTNEICDALNYNVTSCDNIAAVDELFPPKNISSDSLFQTNTEDLFLPESSNRKEKQSMEDIFSFASRTEDLPSNGEQYDSKDIFSFGDSAEKLERNKEQDKSDSKDVVYSSGRTLEEDNIFSSQSSADMVKDKEQPKNNFTDSIFSSDSAEKNQMKDEIKDNPKNIFSSSLDTDLFGNKAKLKKAASETEDLFSDRKSNDDLFTSDTDLFGVKSKPKELDPVEKKESVRISNDDLFSSDVDIFGGKPQPKSSKKTEPTDHPKKKQRDDLFFEEDDSDLFSANATKSTSKQAADVIPSKTVPKSGPSMISKSIFDDDDEEDDGDIFASIRKKPSKTVVKSENTSERPKTSSELGKTDGSKLSSKTVKSSAQQAFVDPLTALNNED